MDETTKRLTAYHARRIIRAKSGTPTDKKLRKLATPYVMRLVEILPALLAIHCVAKAEDLAHKQLENEL